MGRGRKRKQPPVDEESADIAATKAALEPLLAAKIPVPRMASAAGAHPSDMQGFLEGRVSLTWELRRRLRAQIESLLESVDPDRPR